jgi:hypothetical protein
MGKKSFQWYLHKAIIAESQEKGEGKKQGYVYFCRRRVRVRVSERWMHDEYVQYCVSGVIMILSVLSVWIRAMHLCAPNF